MTPPRKKYRLFVNVEENLTLDAFLVAEQARPRCRTHVRQTNGLLL